MQNIIIYYCVAGSLSNFIILVLVSLIHMTVTFDTTFYYWLASFTEVTPG